MGDRNNSRLSEPEQGNSLKGEAMHELVPTLVESPEATGTREAGTGVTDCATTSASCRGKASSRASTLRCSPYLSGRVSGVLFTLAGRYGAYQTNMGSAPSTPRADESATAGKLDSPPDMGSALGDDERASM
ncbi:hypothetical protein EHS25_008139 [Saitozyma podzolica]|jgi:hypothetical protein|uniref:Uncharacterized protein n=1 Tax=Saitozyma podzolica TaxID=1890683 RepID=A0A427YNL0_9TREE|nr:hypothetical protein EHS25_008139 [Saitozyma podzolica]